MKTKLTLLALALLALTGSVTLADPMGTAFPYQGKLNVNGQPANGSYDPQFTLYDAFTAGSVRGALLTNNAVPVNNGLFTLRLDFDAGVFNGQARCAINTKGNTL